MARKCKHDEYIGRQLTDSAGRVFVIFGSRGEYAKCRYINYDDRTINLKWTEIFKLDKKTAKTAQTKNAARPEPSIHEYEFMVSELVAQGVHESEAVFLVEQQHHLHGDLWFSH